MNESALLQRVIRKVQKWRNLALLRKQHVTYGEHLCIRGLILVEGTHITLGSHVRINSGEQENLIGGPARTIFRTIDNGSITIGDHTGISNTAIVARKSVTIGEHVFLGGGVKIYDNDFHSLDASVRERGLEGICTGAVTIRDHAFIGAHSIILKGVTIGEYSIVGAGSVVTKDVPDGEVWGGNPARFLRKCDEVSRGTKYLT